MMSNSSVPLVPLNGTHGTATESTSSESSSSLLWAIPRLFVSLSKAAEQQAQETQDDTISHNIASLNYFVSPYAGLCMLMGIVLNRTVVFASSRRQSRSTSRSPNLVLRAIAIYVMITTLWDVIVQFGFIYPSFAHFIGTAMPEKRQPLSSLLWEVYITLCVSQFLETFSSITSGEDSSTDTGLSLFEHSLAFQECQNMSRPSPQLLVICVFALITQITTHLMGVTGTKKYQLIPSTILGLSFICFYIYSAFTDALIFFPGIVVISLIPQILVLGIIGLCMTIYGLAYLASSDPDSLTYTPMMRNLKDSVNLQWNDDFNSFLMRFGFIMFVAVDGDEYVNEISELRFSQGTYQDNHNHLLTGYFNKLDNNPEMAKYVKKEEEDEGIAKNWVFFRKIMNIVRLLQSIFKFTVKLHKHRTKKRSQKKIGPPRTTKKYIASTASLQDDDLLDEIDDSSDFNPDSDSDLEPLEYDSEFDDEQPSEYISTLAMARQRDANGFTASSSSATSTTLTHRAPPIEELFTAQDMLHIIRPTDLTEASYISRIRAHIVKDQRLTRSQYCNIEEDDLLREVIIEKRPHYDNEHDEHDDMNCVVCQTERRSVVLWPCKCFALCEGCRLSLGVRGFAICVCCRAKVDGYSKVYMP